jgi:hypothetical protein
MFNDTIHVHTDFGCNGYDIYLDIVGVIGCSDWLEWKWHRTDH